MSVPDGLVRQCVERTDSEFAIVDTTGQIVYTNTAWQEFAVDGDVQCDPTMVGQNYIEVVGAARGNDEFAAAAFDGLQALLSGNKEVFKLEYPCPGPTSPDAWFLMWASPVTYEGDEYIVIEHLEITERKRAERQLETRNKRLESVSSILAHDIRNPMSAAISWGEVVANADDPEREDIERMISALRRMDGMIDDALFLARGLTVEETERARIGEYCDRAWAAVASETATLNIDDDDQIAADPDLLQTLFENLFRNSVEHGGETVAVRVGLLENGVYIEDDGPGIPESKRESVFETGYTTRSTAENAGMGLSIVEGIVDAHEWNIAVTGSASGGARFEVTGVTQCEEPDPP